MPINYRILQISTPPPRVHEPRRFVASANTILTPPIPDIKIAFNDFSESLKMYSRADLLNTDNSWYAIDTNGINGLYFNYKVWEENRETEPDNYTEVFIDLKSLAWTSNPTTWKVKLDNYFETQDPYNLTYKCFVRIPNNLSNYYAVSNIISQTSPNDI